MKPKQTKPNYLTVCKQICKRPKNICVRNTRVRSFVCLGLFVLGCLFVWVCLFVLGCLMPNPFLYIYTVLFQTIKFSKSNVSMSKTVIFQAIQFSI